MKTTDTDEKRLHFLHSIVLEHLGMRWSELARAAGISQQRLSWWITSDDIHLDMLQEVLGSIGIRIEPTLVPRVPQKEKAPPGERYRIVGELPSTASLERRMKDSVKAALGRCVEDDNRMAFLARFILELNRPLSYFLSRSGMERNGLLTILSHDSIKVSQLMRIADVFEQTVEWHVSAIRRPGGA